MHHFWHDITRKSSIHLRHSDFWEWCSSIGWRMRPPFICLIFFARPGRLVGKKCPALAIGKHVLIVSKTKLLIINCLTKETREVDDSRWCLCAADGPKIYLADKDPLLALSSRTSIWMIARHDAIITDYVAVYKPLKYVWLCNGWSRSDNLMVKCRRHVRGKPVGDSFLNPFRSTTEWLRGRRGRSWYAMWFFLMVR